MIYPDDIPEGRFTTPPPDVEAILAGEPPKIEWGWLSEVEPKTMEWLWYPYLAANALNFISGDPGTGKTYACLAIAAAFSAGIAFPHSNGSGPPPASRVLYLHSEDEADDALLPRLTLMGVDARRVAHSKGRSMRQPGKACNDYLSVDRPDLFERLLDEVKPRLVILDPIESFMGKCNPNAADEVRPRLDYLADLARRKRFTILAIRFDRKAGAEKAIHKSAGAMTWVAAGRSFLACTEDPDRPNVRTPAEHTTYGIFCHTKVNHAAKGESLRYVIRSRPTEADPHPIGEFAWDGISTHSAEDLISTKKRHETETETTRDTAKDWLIARLRQGKANSDDLIREAEQQGICSRRTLFRAKKELGIHATKRGFQEDAHWEWELVEVDLPAEYQG